MSPLGQPAGALSRRRSPIPLGPLRFLRQHRTAAWVVAVLAPVLITIASLPFRSILGAAGVLFFVLLVAVAAGMLRRLAARPGGPRARVPVGRVLPLTNTAKHAAASVAKVTVEEHDGLLRTQISDDGVGGADLKRGTGLVGLTDRVEALGGNLAISSPSSAGTTVVAELPT